VGVHQKNIFFIEHLKLYIPCIRNVDLDVDAPETKYRTDVGGFRSVSIVTIFYTKYFRFYSCLLLSLFV